MTYFHERDEAAIDLDNMLKPILDALNGLVYADDRLIVDVHARKSPIDDPIQARYASPVLLGAFTVGDPFVHVIIDVAPRPADPPR